MRAIAALALECAERPELLSDFLAVLKLAPKTIVGLQAAAAGHGAVVPPMKCVSALELLQ